MKTLKESRINIHFCCKNTLVMLLKVLVQKKELKKNTDRKDKFGNVNDLFSIPAIAKEGLYSLLKLLIQYLKMFI